MVVLDKPIGLTLAPDPSTGKIVVQSIKEGSPAAECGMIQVGDIVKMCSAVFGEDMWQAVDIRRIRWAINNRTSKIKLVLERACKPNGTPSWYYRGQVGRVSQERDPLQLPVSFTSSSPDDWPQDIPAPGRPLMIAFHTWLPGASQVPQRTGSAAMARAARLQVLREALSDARREPEMELGALLAPGPSGSAGGLGGSGPGSGLQRAGSGGSVGAGKAGGRSNGAAVSASGPLGRLMESLTGGVAAASGSSNNTGVGGPGGSTSAAPGTNTAVAARAALLQEPGMSQRGLPGAKEKKVTPVLPWLLVSSCRLDTRDLTQIASHRGLSAVLELGLCRAGGALAVRGSESAHAAASLAEVNVSAFLAGTQPGSAGAVGAGLLGRGTRSPGSAGSLVDGEGATPGGAMTEQRYRQLIHAAAALQRLVIRRAHGSVHHSPPDACHVLLHCLEPGMEGEVACLLAAWLHWYACMPLQEALLSAEIALGCAIEQGVVEGATEALVHGADERSSRVVLTWRYGGLSASVAGDVVGSWATRMPLLRCKNPMGCKGSVARGNFYLELSGLRPGMYYYKYIVDGTWAVDPASPKVLDASGNWNNVLEVHARPPVGSSRERLTAARWHAAHLAWETKMGLLRPAH